MAVVTKILEQTLTAGQTSVIFTDTDIPNSLIRVFASNTDAIPTSRILSGNNLTVTYEAQSANMGVALEIVKQGLEIIDNVTSSDADKALSAKQGKALNDSITNVAGDLSDLATVVNNLDIPDNITDLDDVNVTSISDGQVLAWDEVSQKFVNVNQSGGSSSDDYSTSEVKIGKWIDDSDIYRKVFDLGASPLDVSYSSWTTSSITIPNSGQLLRCDGISTSNVFSSFIGYFDSNVLKVITPRNNNTINVQKFILEYTKTS